MILGGLLFLIFPIACALYFITGLDRKVAEKYKDDESKTD